MKRTLLVVISLLSLQYGPPVYGQPLSGLRDSKFGTILNNLGSDAEWMTDAQVDGRIDSIVSDTVTTTDLWSGTSEAFDDYAKYVTAVWEWSKRAETHSGKSETAALKLLVALGDAIPQQSTPYKSAGYDVGPGSVAIACAATFVLGLLAGKWLVVWAREGRIAKARGITLRDFKRLQKRVVKAAKPLHKLVNGKYAGLLAKDPKYVSFARDHFPEDLNGNLEFEKMNVPEVGQLIEAVKASVREAAVSSEIISALEKLGFVKYKELLNELGDGFSQPKVREVLKGRHVRPVDLHAMDWEGVLNLISELKAGGKPLFIGAVEKEFNRKLLDLLQIKAEGWPGPGVTLGHIRDITSSLMFSSLTLSALMIHSEEDPTAEAFMEGLKVSDASIPQLVAGQVRKGLLVAKYQQVQFQ